MAGRLDEVQREETRSENRRERASGRGWMRSSQQQGGKDRHQEGGEILGWVAGRAEAGNDDRKDMGRLSLLERIFVSRNRILRQRAKCQFPSERL